MDPYAFTFGLGMVLGVAISQTITLIRQRISDANVEREKTMRAMIDSTSYHYEFKQEKEDE